MSGTGPQVMTATDSQAAAAVSAAAMVLATARFLLPQRGPGVRRLTADASASTKAHRSLGTAALTLRQVGVGQARGAGAGAAVARSPSARRAVGVGLGGVLAVAICTVLGMQTIVSLVALGAVGAVVLSQRARQRRRRAEAARRASVIEACAVLAADLRAGRPPQDALEGAAAVCSDLQPAAAAARLGGDVGAALDQAAGTPGATGLRSLGAAWRVAERSGAAFATIVERLADSLRADESVRRQVAAGLAGTRSTARLLAALPLFGTALGYGVGADPLSFLTGTPIGWVCLLVGLTLAVIGLEWVERLAATCERDR